MAFTLPDLPYPTNALEPAIDARTMEIHHGKHHGTYVSKLNDALAGTDWLEKPIDEVLRNLSQVPDAKRTAVRNNGGGHYNHAMFWPLLAPPGKGGGGSPGGELAQAIDSDLGGFDKLKEQFTAAAIGRFGSGWAWLCVADGKLNVCSTANQDNPIMAGIGDAAGCGGEPVLGLDVWEHAYYLNYQNRRPDYVEAFWSVVNWEQAEKNYAAAKSLAGSRR